MHPERDLLNSVDEVLSEQYEPGFFNRFNRASQGFIRGGKQIGRGLGLADQPTGDERSVLNRGTMFQGGRRFLGIPGTGRFGQVAGGAADMIGSGLRMGLATSLLPSMLRFDGQFSAGNRRYQDMFNRRNNARTAALGKQGDELRARKAEVEARRDAIKAGTDPETKAKLDAITPESVRAKMDAERAQRQNIGPTTSIGAALAAGPPAASAGGGPMSRIRQAINNIRQDAKNKADMSRGAEMTRQGKMGPFRPNVIDDPPKKRPSLVDRLNRDEAERQARETGPQFPANRVNPNIDDPYTKASRDKTDALLPPSRSLRNRLIRTRFRETGSRPENYAGRSIEDLSRPGAVDASGQSVIGLQGRSRGAVRGRVSRKLQDLRLQKAAEKTKQNSMQARANRYMEQDKAKDSNSVDAQMARYSKMTPEERAAELNASNTRRTNVPDSFKSGYKPETDNERRYAGMRKDMGLDPRMSNRQMGQGRRRYGNQV